jgi:hypothetical protein
MRILCAALMLSIPTLLCHAQDGPSDTTFLRQPRAKYDAPFERNLQSFDCSVEFDWKQHFKEVVRLGDEGSDEEIQKLIQPIRNRVTVTRTNASVSSGMTDSEISKLPHGGMAESLLEHAVQFSMNNWVPASNNAILPSDSTAIHVEPLPTGYNVGFKIQTFDVAMKFTPDMRLESEGLKGSATDRRLFEFHSGPNGFLLTSFTMGEDGNLQPGNRIILTYTYQTVDGFQLPKQVGILRESHHEGWHYQLSDCNVRTGD